MPVLTLDLRWEQHATAGETRTPFTLRWQQDSTDGKTLNLHLNWFQCSSSSTAGCALTPTLEALTGDGVSKWLYSDCTLEPFDISAGVKQAKIDAPLESLICQADSYGIIANFETLTCEGVTTFFDSECHLEPITCQASANGIIANLESLESEGVSKYQFAFIEFEPITAQADSYGIIANTESLDSTATSITRPHGSVDTPLEALIASGTTNQTFDGQVFAFFEELQGTGKSKTGTTGDGDLLLLKVYLEAKSKKGNVAFAHGYLQYPDGQAKSGYKINNNLPHLECVASSKTGTLSKFFDYVTRLEYISCSASSVTGAVSQADAETELFTVTAHQATHSNQTEFEYLTCRSVSVRSSTIIGDIEAVSCASHSVTGSASKQESLLEYVKINTRCGSKSESDIESIDLISHASTGGISYLDDCDLEPIELTAKSYLQSVSKLLDKLESLDCEADSELGTISVLTDGQLSELILQAEGLTGTISRAVVELPHLNLSEKVSSNTFSKAELELPALQIHVSRYVQQAYSALALQMNTETNAASVFTQYPYHSLGVSKKGYIAATNSGIFLLDGETDNGLPIDAFIRSGFFDLAGMEGIENSAIKRCTGVYVGYRANGDMVLTLKTDGEAHPQRYVLQQHESGLTEQRVKTGKGVKSRYWQYELKNASGSDFSLDQIEFLFEMLSRKVR